MKLGVVIGQLAVIEWQKRGLPHAHLLLIFDPATKLRTTREYDSVVSAEIPPPGHVLHDLVLEHMIHVCGEHCLKDNKCKRGFPRPLLEATRDRDDGFPEYRRRAIPTASGGSSGSKPWTANVASRNSALNFRHSFPSTHCPDRAKTTRFHLFLLRV